MRILQVIQNSQLIKKIHTNGKSRRVLRKSLSNAKNW
jgi:hypothetical protein